MDSGFDINTLSQKRETVLLIAIKNNHLDLANYLLDRGADPKIVGSGNDTTLHHAANFGDIALCKRLIAAGTDPAATDGRKRMPVHYAAERGIAEVIPLVAPRPAFANVTDSFGNTAVDLAIGSNNEATVLAVLEAGGRFNGTEEEARRRIDQCVQKKMYDAVSKALSQMAKAPRLQETLLERAMTTALSEGDQTFIARLSSTGTLPPNLARNQLFNAVDLSSIEVLNLVLEHTSDVNATRKFTGWAPIHAAALRGDPAIFNALLAKGADPKLVDSLGRNTLHLAALSPNGSLIPTLLQAGLQPAAPDILGNTPLHYAALQGNDAAVKELLDAKAPQPQNREGNTPYDVAIANNHEDIAKLLTPSHRPPVGYYKFASTLATDNSPEAVAQARDRWLSAALHGSPLLHIAIMAGSLQAVQQLLAVDPNAIKARDADGFLPIHIAAETGNTEIVKALLAAGAAVNDQENLARWTPLHCAAENGTDAAVKALLEKGANTKAADANGKTPKVVAQQLHREQIAALL